MEVGAFVVGFVDVEGFLVVLVLVWWVELVDTVVFLVVQVVLWWVELVGVTDFLVVLVEWYDELVETSAVADAIKSRIGSQ